MTGVLQLIWVGYLGFNSSSWSRVIKMSISTTYQIISKNETYSLNWPTELLFDETAGNEEPFVEF